MSLPLFSIVVPVYQNRESLRDTVAKLLALAGQLPARALELVLVDDGSTDGSRDLLRELVQEHPESIQAVFLSRNFGQTPAIQAGLQYARGDAVGIISCDLQEPHEKFADMLALWAEGHLFVIGKRVERAEGSAHKGLSSIYWKLVRHFIFPHFPEMGYDFCVLDRRIVEQINRMNEKNSSIFVLIFWLGYKPAIVPITRQIRTKGRSQWGLRKKLRFTFDTLIGFTNAPARLITYLGLSTAFCALVYLVYMLHRWYTLRAAPPGWMTVVGLIILFGSLNLFALGLLSEYLLRVLDESRKRPPFVVEAVIGKPRE